MGLSQICKATTRRQNANWYVVEMPIIGYGVAFLGYSLLYYGLSQLQGGNWGYLDLVLASRWTTQTAQILKDGK